MTSRNGESARLSTQAHRHQDYGASGSTPALAQSGAGTDTDVEGREGRDGRAGGCAGTGTLRRGLAARQVQMIAIGGTIGTGLFLGTGRSLAQGGPASILICYSLVGFIVYVTLSLLGEMATQYPVAGMSKTIVRNLVFLVVLLVNTYFIPFFFPMEMVIKSGGLIS